MSFFEDISPRYPQEFNQAEFVQYFFLKFFHRLLKKMQNAFPQIIMYFLGEILE